MSFSDNKYIRQLIIRKNTKKQLIKNGGQFLDFSPKKYNPKNSKKL